MINYYQDTEAGNSKWIEFDEQNRTQILLKAYHMGIYSLESRPGESDLEDAKIKRKGDLWLDIDFKPENDSPEEIHKAISLAIEDVQKLAKYLISIKAQLSDCLWFASGKKGFHVCIPGKLFGAGRPTHNLPLIYKYMAATIAARANMMGVDLSLYCMGKGKMLRVENKQRENGKYKVPLTSDEVLVMTPSLYEELVSQPRLLGN